MEKVRLAKKRKTGHVINVGEKATKIVEERLTIQKANHQSLSSSNARLISKAETLTFVKSKDVSLTKNSL